MNKYIYALNNTYKYVDRDGNRPIKNDQYTNSINNSTNGNTDDYKSNLDNVSYQSPSSSSKSVNINSSKVDKTEFYYEDFDLISKKPIIDCFVTAKNKISYVSANTLYLNLYFAEIEFQVSTKSCLSQEKADEKTNGLLNVLTETLYERITDEKTKFEKSHRIPIDYIVNVLYNFVFTKCKICFIYKSCFCWIYKCILYRVLSCLA